MRRKVEENLGGIGATAVAFVFVLVYSLWGAFVLHTDTSHVTAAEQQTLAVK